MKTPQEVRQACREGRFCAPTCGLAPGFIQANLAIFTKDWADDFLEFAKKNPQPVPLLEVGGVGDYQIRQIAKNADVRTDLPLYRIWKNGVLVEEVPHILDFWREDLVYFLIGCSFSFEESLTEAGLPLRHVEEGVNVPMYRTNLMCQGAGKIPSSPMVVSMRPYLKDQVQQAIAITEKMPAVHGAPVHVGDPQSIGIKDLSRPDFGDSVTINPGEIPVFWACGVTPQSAVMEAKPSFMISHAPGHMFVGDKKNDEYKVSEN